MELRNRISFTRMSPDANRILHLLLYFCVKDIRFLDGTIRILLREYMGDEDSALRAWLWVIG